MSHTEIHIGTLVKVKDINSLDDLKHWSNKNNSVPEGDDSLEDYLGWYDEDKAFERDAIIFVNKDEPDIRKYVYFGKVLYQLENYQEQEDFDLDIWNKTPDGKINFVTAFYNGGTCFGEVLEDGLKQLNNK